MVREISYSDIKGSLKTGDLMLFHGEEPSSKLIEIIEWSYWSHVGMVIIPEDIGLTGKEPLILEATSSGDGIEDVINKAPKEGGVMLISLEERLNVDISNRYDTHFKVKYINRTLNVVELEQLKAFIYEAHDKKFPNDKELFKYYLEGRHYNEPMPDNMAFCSQLVAETFMALGLLSKRYVSNGYCPNDFNEDKDLPILKPFYILDGARLK
ncbi:hypothetical protein [Fusibacter sp. 3D3]|uniref:hypothetical protein n=1 Tax=Fusibacter sp. 3D3 TaxID=1048380 RepID=UPI000852B3B8|nr:hypothetical protein [Fusibacter sp. 3D3]GAU78761.1 hypothetical protein F3D3_3396 [Fusibacter sp. 3D3]